jgi:hypothetical protein
MVTRTNFFWHSYQDSYFPLLLKALLAKKIKFRKPAVTKYDTTDNKLAPVQAVATPGTHREAGLLTKPNQQPIDLRPPSNNGVSVHIKIKSDPPPGSLNLRGL